MDARDAIIAETLREVGDIMRRTYALSPRAFVERADELDPPKQEPKPLLAWWMRWRLPRIRRIAGGKP